MHNNALQYIIIVSVSFFNILQLAMYCNAMQSIAFVDKLPFTLAAHTLYACKLHMHRHTGHTRLYGIYGAYGA